jgi:hypothetical protein
LLLLLRPIGSSICSSIVTLLLCPTRSISLLLLLLLLLVIRAALLLPLPTFLLLLLCGICPSLIFPTIQVEVIRQLQLLIRGLGCQAVLLLLLLIAVVKVSGWGTLLTPL